MPNFDRKKTKKKRKTLQRLFQRRFWEQHQTPNRNEKWRGRPQKLTWASSWLLPLNAAAFSASCRMSTISASREVYLREQHARINPRCQRWSCTVDTGSRRWSFTSSSNLQFALEAKANTSSWEYHYPEGSAWARSSYVPRTIYAYSDL